jgi:hypothetical protein
LGERALFARQVQAFRLLVLSCFSCSRLATPSPRFLHMFHVLRPLYTCGSGLQLEPSCYHFSRNAGIEYRAPKKSINLSICASSFIGTRLSLGASLCACFIVFFCVCYIFVSPTILIGVVICVRFYFMQSKHITTCRHLLSLASLVKVRQAAQCLVLTKRNDEDVLLNTTCVGLVLILVGISCLCTFSSKIGAVRSRRRPRHLFAAQRPRHQRRSIRVVSKEKLC